MSSDAKILEGIGEYKYGFKDPSTYVFKTRKGLGREIVEQISAMKDEPDWMLEFRLKALDHFMQRPMPTWGGDLSGLDMDDIYFYTKPTDQEEKSWDEKWRRNPVGAAVWAIILIWAGLVLLTANLGTFPFLGWSRAWGAVFAGAAVIIVLGALFRLAVPSYRRPVGGTLILAAILLGIGLGILFNTYLVWPLVLIAIGVGALLRGLGIRR